MSAVAASGAEPSSVPTDPPAVKRHGTELDRPVISLEGHRLRLARRLRSGLGRARSDRRRLVPALVVATMAASITWGGLSSVLTGSEPVPAHGSAQPADPRVDEPPQPVDRAAVAADDGHGWDPVVVGDDHRTLALDRSSVLLPTEIGHRVEVVALTPTLESVKASVVAESATVVAVDESVVVVRLSTHEARRAVEAGAVGSLTLLGTG